MADLRAAADPADQFVAGNAVPVAGFLELPAINLPGQNPQRLVSLLLVTDATQGDSHPLPAVPHLRHHHDACLRLNAQQPRYRPRTKTEVKGKLRAKHQAG
jgi:hypothetical protein